MISRDDASRSSWAALLTVSPVLRHLTPDRLQELIGDSSLQLFEQGAELVSERSRPNTALLVVEGACEAEFAEGTSRLEAPALLAESEALADMPVTATVRAINPVTAVVIDRERLLDAIRASAAAGQSLTELVADHLCAREAGELVGRFIVDGVIGEGGAGRVLRARHALLGTPLALKMLSHALALSPGGARAFIREASVLLHLDHPGIVRVLDAFAAHGTFFIVMPWVEGATLREHIDGDFDFSRDEVLELAEEGLDALVALHAAGLVHRDIKPSNILIKPSGRMVLIDFGIACQRDRVGSGRQLVGSPSYCSPEQILGRPVDGRSDVYSLGCTLYELVFGRPPFIADDIDGVIEGHLRRTPSFDLVPRVPMGEPFMRWLRSCLLRTRAQRPDAAAARAQLGYLMPTSTAERSAPRARVTIPVPMFLLTGEFSTNP